MGIAGMGEVVQFLYGFRYYYLRVLKGRRGMTGRLGR